MESNIQELIKLIDQTRKDWGAFIKKADPKIEVYPSWTIKEVLGHITAWEIVIHKAIKVFIAGEPPYFLHEQDFDLFNQAAVNKRSGWTLADVIREWKVVRAALRKTISDLNAEDLPKEMVLPWGSERSLRELIEIVAEHEAEHLEEIRKSSKNK